MARKRTNVLITIELIGTTGNEKEDLPAVAHVSGQAHDAAAPEMRGRSKSTSFAIAGTDSAATIKTNALAALDPLTGVP